MKTNNYQLDYFLLDESFQSYALHTKPEDVEHWEAWIRKHPDASEIVQSARNAIMFIAERRVIRENQSIRDQVLDRLTQQIFAEKKQFSKAAKKIPMKLYWYAASITLLISLAFMFKYFYRAETPLITSQFLEVMVPDGQRSQIVLPDGTKVWLNSGSELKYPVDFLEKARAVYISGEAFFNVKHKNNKPFIVRLKKNISIKVLGTEFNVKCYPTDKDITTTLLNGSLTFIIEDGKKGKIQEIYLKPKEKVVYLKENQEFVVTELASTSEEEKSLPTTKAKIKEIKVSDEIEDAVAWKDERLVFHDETFEAIAIRMQRWYGMKITITDENLKKERFTGKFVNNETIYQVLDIFNRSESIQYTSRNKEIIISKRKQKLNP
jgi:transmembrane sensor